MPGGVRWPLRAVMGKHSSQVPAGIADARHCQDGGWCSLTSRAVVAAALTGSMTTENYEPLLVLLRVCVCVWVCARAQGTGSRYGVKQAWPCRVGSYKTVNPLHHLDLLISSYSIQTASDALTFSPEERKESS